MVKKEQLFLLIKSLTKAEKRYFKLFAQMGGASKNYLRLFDVIDKMAEYDEQQIKHRFRNEAFVRQLHVTKNHLTGLLMKSLRNFHAQHSVDARLKDALRDIEILHKRELPDLCAQMVQRAKTMAIKYEKFPELLELIGWERKLMLASAEQRRDKVRFNRLLREEKTVLTQMANVAKYWHLTMNFSDYLLAATDHNSQTKPGLPTLLENENRPKSFAARSLYFYNLQMLAFSRQDIPQVENICDQLISHLEAAPYLIRENPASYITALNNKIGVCLQLQDYAQVVVLLEKIRAIPATYGLRPQSPIAIKAVLQTYNVELEMHRDRGDADAGLALEPEVAQFLNRPRNVIPKDYEILLSYQIAYLYFMKRSYRKSLLWINRMRNQKFGEVREDIQSYAQLLNLIIHFELGNITILKYAVESCRRFLKKKRDLHDFESVLLRFFSRLSMAPRESYAMLFGKLKEELFAGSTEQVRKNALDYLNFESWIDDQIAG